MAKEIKNIFDGKSIGIDEQFEIMKNAVEESIQNCAKAETENQRLLQVSKTLSIENAKLKQQIDILEHSVQTQRELKDLIRDELEKVLYSKAS